MAATATAAAACGEAVMSAVGVSSIVDALAVYKQIAIETLCATVCPNLAMKFVNRELIATEFALPLDTYVRALLQARPDTELAKQMEDTMVQRMKVPFANKAPSPSEPTPNKMHEARYRIEMRRDLDANPETVGKPSPPAVVWFDVLELEASETNQYAFKRHSSGQFPYPMDVTTSQFHEQIKNQDSLYNGRARPFRVYLNAYPANGKTWTCDDLECLDGSQMYPSIQRLDSQVNMSQYRVGVLIVFVPDFASRASSKAKKPRTADKCDDDE
jgi:hypothetical protein